MSANEPTLPLAYERILRAGFRDEPDDDPFILETLFSTSARERVLALRAAHRRLLLGPSQWRHALEDPDVEVRREALALLAHHDDVSEELTYLRRALDDPDALVVDAAIFALGEHLDAGSVQRLCELAQHHDDPRCRESAVAALGAIGDDRGLAAVLAALEDKPPVRRRAIVALSNFEGPDVQAALERAKDDRDWQVRAAVDQLNKEPTD